MAWPSPVGWVEPPGPAGACHRADPRPDRWAGPMVNSAKPIVAADGFRFAQPILHVLKTAYSALTFAALMIGVQRATSLLTRAASGCCPRCCFRGMSLPNSKRRLRVLSSSSALSSASVSLSRIGFGVALGANKPFQAETWNAGRPASVDVGTSGNNGWRSSVAITNALIVPARTYETTLNRSGHV